MENGEIPENANEHCPGPQSESAGKSDACEGCPNQQICATAPKGPDPDLVAIAERMATVKHKILVLSGKGGVGKSTFSAQLAFALAARDFQVGLLDVDICGPSIPKMLGLEGQEIHQSNLGWSPVYVESNLGVMSIGFMLPNPDEAVIWRGPRKNGLIKQFLKDVYWGELDFLIVDAPPGTSDEHISIVQCLDATGVDGAIIVTTPQQVSLIDVRKEVNFCKKVGVKVLGVVENMSSLCQPITDFKFMRMSDNGEQKDVTQWVWEYMKEKAPEMLNLIACTEVFDSRGGGAVKMCIEMRVPFLGKVPLDPQLCKAAEEGTSCFANKDCVVSAPALKKIIEDNIHLEEEKQREDDDYIGTTSKPNFSDVVLSEQDLFWDTQELSSLLAKENLNNLSISLSNNPSLASSRGEAVDWILKLNLHHSFSTLTALLAVNYLDRFLFTLRFQNDKPWLTQLVAVACLSLAAKVEETHVPLFVDLQVGESKYLFEAKTVKRMEILVLSTLGWKMNPVTPLSFLDYITRKLGLKGHLCLEFLRRCETVLLSVFADSRFMSFLPSVLATATMMRVVSVVEPGLGEEYQDQLLGILGIDKEKVKECYKVMMEVVSGKSEEGKRGNLKKRKFECIQCSRNDVMEGSFSCDSSCDSLKKSRSQDQLLLKHSNSDFLTIPR